MTEATTEIEIECPYCGELVEVIIEADLTGELVHDCEVCCNPWQLDIARSEGALVVRARRLDD